MLSNATLSALLTGSKAKNIAESQYNANKRIKDKSKGSLNRPWMPQESKADYQELYRKSVSPWGETIAEIHAQVCQIDGYSGPKELWERWLADGMQAKQDVLFFEAITYGYSFLAVLPAVIEGRTEEGEIVEKDSVVFTPMSPLNTHAFYDDDPYATTPMFVLQKLNKNMWVYIDDEAVYRFRGTPERIAEMVSVEEHNLGYCPVIRIENKVTPKNEIPESAIERCFTAADALTDARFTMSMVNRYASFPQKWGSGMTKPVEGAPPLRPSVASMIADANADAKFGTFDAADMQGLAVSIDKNLAALAMLGHVPMYLLNGGGTIANLSAEALSSLEQNFFRAADNRKTSLALGINDAMGIAGDILGFRTIPSDTVHWQDMTPKSLSQVASSIGELSRTGMPLAPLYQMIPGVDHTQALKYEEEAMKYQSASNAGALVDLDAKRVSLAKQFMDMDENLSLEEALKMARFRFPDERKK